MVGYGDKKQFIDHIHDQIIEDMRLALDYLENVEEYEDNKQYLLKLRTMSEEVKLAADRVRYASRVCYATFFLHHSLLNNIICYTIN